jgi:nucleotide-binding universal stress UspA family protein
MLFVQTPLGSTPVAFEDLGEAEVLGAKEELEGQALLDQALARLRAAGKPGSGILKRGDAASEIMEVVREKNIDLLVTGSRGRSPIMEWMMGSVSRKLVHYSGCSVLVVRQ